MQTFTDVCIPSPNEFHTCMDTGIGTGMAMADDSIVGRPSDVPTSATAVSTDEVAAPGMGIGMGMGMGVGRCTFSFFSGCSSDSHASIVLRGAKPHEVASLKVVTRLAVHIAYHLRLEKALHIDHGMA